MNEMPHVGWRDPLVSGTLTLSAVALALFVFVELRSPMPILSFSLFRIRLFTASMFSLFFITSHAIGDQFSHAFLFAGRPALSPDTDGLDYYRQLRGHRLGGADRRLVVGSHGFAPAVHDRIDNHRRRPIFYCLIAHGCIDLAHHRAVALDIGLGLGNFQFAQPERDPGLGAARRSRSSGPVTERKDRGCIAPTSSRGTEPRIALWLGELKIAQPKPIKSNGAMMRQIDASMGNEAIKNWPTTMIVDPIGTAGANPCDPTTSRRSAPPRR